MLCIVRETTARVLTERRPQFLDELSVRMRCLCHPREDMFITPNLVVGAMTR
jgi:hypothetical protein